MPEVVVAGGIIQCSHGGQIQFSGGADQLEVSGAKAITFGAEAGLSFQVGSPGVVVPCPWTNNATTPPTLSPCASTLAAVAGVSTLLTIGGVGVLLDNATGFATNPSDPSASWSIATAGQTLLSADS